ncbi:endonuclease, partial [Klebsiella pneumoniae]
ADQGACAPWTRGNNCPPVEKMNYFESDLSGEKQLEPLPDFNSMSRKELRELNARLRQVRPKRRKGYKQEINDRLRLQLEHELKSRGFDGSENE